MNAQTFLEKLRKLEDEYWEKSFRGRTSLDEDRARGRSLMCTDLIEMIERGDFYDNDD